MNKRDEYVEDLDRREEEFLKPLEEKQEKKKKRASIAERVRRKFDPTPKPDERVFAGPAALGRIVHCCQCSAVKRDGAKWMEAVPVTGRLIIALHGEFLIARARPLCGLACAQKELRKWLKAEQGE